MYEIGKFIKEKRKAANYSQEQLAKECGLKHDSTICNIEKGIRKISLEELSNISKVLGNFNIFEALSATGYITKKDIHPITSICQFEELEQSELQELQQFVDFLIYKKNNNKERG